LEPREKKGPRTSPPNKLKKKPPAGEWIFLDPDVATAPAGAVTVQAFTIYVDFSGSNTSQGVYFDDRSLCVLDADGSGCEPAEDGD